MPRSGAETGAVVSEDRQRIDKWLWHARVVRTRSAAAALADRGYVRVNGEKIDAPSRLVRAGDVVTVALDRIVRVMKVRGFAPRRGGPEAARVLYEDIAPDSNRTAAAGASMPARERGSGRPTKQERRAVDRLREHEDT
jgi:ribosome-associated heat shock protein Hsp15